ncbi:MAG: hypothetical protein IPF82_21505 [Blastocatellia bacterium]|nr:hypothetical protein [Blastocatellia bacterium]
MADLNNQDGAVARLQAASAARLRSLARPGFEVRSFLREITAVEIAAILGLIVLFGAVFFIYFRWILPDQVRRLTLSNEVAANSAKIDELRALASDPAALTAAYQSVHESLDSFRGLTLQPRTSGRLQIIGLVNDLTRETNVELTSPISFEARNPLADEANEKGGKAKRKTRKNDDEIQTYPSLTMTCTISGSYPQIRAFLAKFESSRQCGSSESVVISSSEEDEETGERGSRGRSAERRPTGAISLDISMTGYFQPDMIGTQPVVAVAASTTGAQ